jgi:hypothetical protein
VWRLSDDGNELFAESNEKGGSRGDRTEKRVYVKTSKVDRKRAGAATPKS